MTKPKSNIKCSHCGKNDKMQVYCTATLKGKSSILYICRHCNKFTKKEDRNYEPQEEEVFTWEEKIKTINRNKQG